MIKHCTSHRSCNTTHTRPNAAENRQQCSMVATLVQVRCTTSFHGAAIHVMPAALPAPSPPRPHVAHTCCAQPPAKTCPVWCAGRQAHSPRPHATRSAQPVITFGAALHGLAVPPLQCRRLGTQPRCWRVHWRLRQHSSRRRWRGGARGSEPASQPAFQHAQQCRPPPDQQLGRPASSAHNNQRLLTPFLVTREHCTHPATSLQRGL